VGQGEQEARALSVAAIQRDVTPKPTGHGTGNGQSDARSIVIAVQLLKTDTAQELLHHNGQGS